MSLYNAVRRSFPYTEKDVVWFLRKNIPAVEGDLSVKLDDFPLDKVDLVTDFERFVNHIEFTELEGRPDCPSKFPFYVRRIAAKAAMESRRGLLNHYAVFKDFVLIWWQGAAAIDGFAQMIPGGTVVHPDWQHGYVKKIRINDPDEVEEHFHKIMHGLTEVKE